MRVLIVEDHLLLAESLALALRLEGHQALRLDVDLDRVTPSELLSAAVRERPQVAVLDLGLGTRIDGADLIVPFTAAGIVVVVMTASTDRSEWGACLHAGAQAVVAKNAHLDEVLAAVRRVDQGLPAMSRRARAELVDLWRHDRDDADADRQRLARLTPREREVLAQLAAGHGVHEIAENDVVSEATVRTQVKAILGKLGVSSQLAAAGLAHRLGRVSEGRRA